MKLKKTMEVATKRNAAAREAIEEYRCPFRQIYSAVNADGKQRPNESKMRTATDHHPSA